MKRALAGVLVSLTMAFALSSGASAATPPGWPSISTSFSPSTVSIGHTTEMTVTVSGADGAFSDLEIQGLFPTGLSVPSSSSSQCGGTLTTTPPPDETPLPNGDANEFTLSGGSLASGGSCTLSVPVTAESAGQMTITTEVSANQGSMDQGYGTAAVLTVPAVASPATVTSAFTPSTITENGTTTWTVQIANPNTSTTLTDVRFFAWAMPTIEESFDPEAVTENTCGGT